MTLDFETSQEAKVYSHLFSLCQSEDQSDIDFVKFGNIFNQSGLKKSQMKRIYKESIQNSPDTKMTRYCFGIFCKFITLKLEGKNIGVHQLSTPTEIPEFMNTICEQAHPKGEVESRTIRWDAKYIFLEKDTRGFVDRVREFTGVAPFFLLREAFLNLGEMTKFWKQYEVDNKYKRELYIYFSQRIQGEELNFAMLLLSLQFLKVQRESGVFLLDAFAQEDQKESGMFKKYFTRFLDNYGVKDRDSEHAVSVNDFFMKEFKVMYSEVPLKQMQDSIDNGSFHKKRRVNRDFNREESPPKKESARRKQSGDSGGRESESRASEKTSRRKKKEAVSRKKEFVQLVNHSWVSGDAVQSVRSLNKTIRKMLGPETEIHSIDSKTLQDLFEQKQKSLKKLGKVTSEMEEVVASQEGYYHQLAKIQSLVANLNEIDLKIDPDAVDFSDLEALETRMSENLREKSEVCLGQLDSIVAMCDQFGRRPKQRDNPHDASNVFNNSVWDQSHKSN